MACLEIRDGQINSFRKATVSNGLQEDPVQEAVKIFNINKIP